MSHDDLLIAVLMKYPGCDAVPICVLTGDTRIAVVFYLPGLARSVVAWHDLCPGNFRCYVEDQPPPAPRKQSA